MSPSAASWRLMQPGDLPDVLRIAAQVHPDYPEHADVFIERQQLYPQGCWVRQHRSQLYGYLLSHPWLLGHPPALNTKLYTLPDTADSYYLHDIALLPAARGSGAANQIIAQLCSQAQTENLATLSLIAVNQSAGFWQRHAFQLANHLVPAEKLHSYSRDACYLVRTVTNRTPTILGQTGPGHLSGQ